MLKVTALFGNQVFSSVLLGLLTSATIFTGVGSVAKMAKNVDDFKVQVPEVKALDEVKSKNSAFQDLAAKNNSGGTETDSTGGNTTSDISGNTSTTNSLLATTETNALNNNTVQATADNRCIITLWGKRYDVTTLQNTHSGGNIFTCGTDMTTVYQSQHGTNLSRMAPYLISDSSTTTANNNVTNNQFAQGGTHQTTGQSNTSVSNSGTSSSQSNRCIVTLWGKQYDVTPLKTGHPGGNIFVCGTDMTNTYQSQHGTNVSMMQQYLVTSSTGSTSGGSTGTSGSQTSSGSASGGSTSGSSYSYRDDDDHEDEHEDDDDEEFEKAWEDAKKRAEYEREAAKKAAEYEHETEDDD